MVVAVTVVVVMVVVVVSDGGSGGSEVVVLLPTSSVSGASFTLLYFTATACRAGSIPDHDRNTMNQ